MSVNCIGYKKIIKKKKTDSRSFRIWHKDE